MELAQLTADREAHAQQLRVIIAKLQEAEQICNQLKTQADQLTGAMFYPDGKINSLKKEQEKPQLVKEK